MAHRIVDLSIPIENDIASDPEPTRPKVTYLTHDMTTPQIASNVRVTMSVLSAA